jgi:formylglycine-generating enzyme required for sulfatase activity
VPEGNPDPRQTLAVLLGASRFERAPKLAQGRAFSNSAQDFFEYLTAPDGLALPHHNVNWRFDDNRSPSDQLREIGDFLENRSADLKNKGTPPQDLIVYYVGHGLFWGPDYAYCLALRATDERSEGLTSIRVSDLAAIIKEHARVLRRFLILDCCFSGAAYKEFQAGPLHAARVKLLDELPQRGTALLCSASAQDPSLAPEGHPRTMFSDALLTALRRGHSSFGVRLSVSELGYLITANLREAYPDTMVRPEVHSPDQREGDVAGVGMFPNPARYEDERLKAEEKRRAQELAEREAAEAERKARAQAEELKRAKAERLRAEKEAEARRRAQEEAEQLKAEKEAEEKRRAGEHAEAERRAKEKADSARRAQKEVGRDSTKSICVGCMANKGSAMRCPDCGWEEGQPAESPQHLPPQSVLDGKYLVGRALGQGGFGITYLGWDLNLNAKLAIKEYFPRDLCTRARDEHTVQPLTQRTRQSFAYGLQKFVEEGQTLARFRNHPGIVSVLGYFQENGTAYLVMAYVEGQTFKHYLEEHKGGRIPYPEAFTILTPVMAALREVHRVDLLHRDVSPDNIYLTKDGQAKLLDFGAARYAMGEADHTLSVILKRGYAPEEQYRPRGRQGPWTDVYALGATFYRAITGTVPTDAPDRLAHDDLIPPRRLGVEISAESEFALLKALAVRTENRFQDIAEFQSAISAPAVRLEVDVGRTAEERPLGPARKAAEAERKAREQAQAQVGARAERLRAEKEAEEKRRARSRLRIRGAIAVSLLAVGTALAWYLIRPPKPPTPTQGPETGTSKAAPSGGPVAEKAPSGKATAADLPKQVEGARAKKPSAGTAISAAPRGSEIRPSGATTPTAGTVRDNPKEGQKYVWIPPGTFQMGCSQGDSECLNDEKPAHEVTLSKGFWMGQTEVTVGAYKRFVQQSGRSMPPEPVLIQQPLNRGWGNDSMPVVDVTWDEAQAYCTWAGGRLPTEAEWEYAARGGSAQARYGPLGVIAWYADNSGEQRLDSVQIWRDDLTGYTKRLAGNGNSFHEVAQKRANGFGLFDVLGNVWEWVNDWYDENYYQNGPSQDPPGPTNGLLRVLRGGSWDLVPSYVRFSGRSSGDPLYRYYYVGFRCVREADRP